MIKQRRPTASRGIRFLARTAHWLSIREAITPNQLTGLSVICSAYGAGLLVYSQQTIALIGCALFVQFRMLLSTIGRLMPKHQNTNNNLLLELAALFSDAMLLVALGYAIGHGWLGWLSALLTLLAAYLRLCSRRLDFQQDFQGPMAPQSFHDPVAKQYHMAVVALACWLGAIEAYFNQTNFLLGVAIASITLGTLITCYRHIRLCADLTQVRETWIFTGEPANTKNPQHQNIIR